MATVHESVPEQRDWVEARSHDDGQDEAGGGDAAVAGRRAPGPVPPRAPGARGSTRRRGGSVSASVLLLQAAATGTHDTSVGEAVLFWVLAPSW